MILSCIRMMCRLIWVHLIWSEPMRNLFKSLFRSSWCMDEIGYAYIFCICILKTHVCIVCSDSSWKSIFGFCTSYHLTNIVYSFDSFQYHCYQRCCFHWIDDFFQCFFSTTRLYFTYSLIMMKEERLIRLDHFHSYDM